MYVPVVTLKTKGNLLLSKQLNKGFKRSVYWNEYKSNIQTQELDNKNLKRIPLDSSFQGVNRLFILTFDNIENGANRVQRNSHQKYFLPRVNITKYNVLNDERNFYDQPIKQSNNRESDHYVTGRWLHYRYFKDHYQLIACDLSKQKELDADPRSLQQIQFYCMLGTNSQVLTVLEKSRETILEFYKGTAKML